MKPIFKIIKLVAVLILLTNPTVLFADNTPTTVNDVQVCFTPPEDCTGLIVTALNNAKKSINVQAYSFTSTPIMRALLASNQRGVAVKILIDKGQVGINKYSPATFLSNNKVPVWVDYKPAIAHNKVMIIDDSVVVTGSFNFTKAAQFSNAENVIILKDSVIANKYQANWDYRLSQSELLSLYLSRLQSKAMSKSHHARNGSHHRKNTDLAAFFESTT